MSDDKENFISESSRRVKKKVENSVNNFCRLCDTNLIVTFGSFAKKSFVNIFKISQRAELSCVLADRLSDTGFFLEEKPSLSQVVCVACARKINNFCQLHELISRKLIPKSSDTGQLRCLKRKSTSPTGKSPAQSKPRVNSPRKTKSRKSLFGNSKQDDFISSTSNIDANLNIDDLDPSSLGFAIKVCIAYKSGNVVVKSKFENEHANILKNLALSQWRTVVNIMLKHSLLREEMLNAVVQEVSKEIKEYSKSDSCLKVSEPGQLATFSNKKLCHEIALYCPIFNAVLRAACGLPEEGGKEQTRSMNALALAASSLVRCRNPTMSAVAYRISMILFNSGVSYENCTRLNHLGVCMSSAMTTEFHRKINENFDYKVVSWKREIEENRSVIGFLEEVQEKQIPPIADDDMELVVLVDCTEATVKGYTFYSPSIYKVVKRVLEKAGATDMSKVADDDIKNAIGTMQSENLPFYKIVADNIDHNIQARIQTKSHTNRSIHWTHQYALKEKVIENEQDAGPQKSIDDVQLIEVLPDSNVQGNLVHQWAVLVSRVITRFIPAFQPLRNVVIYHIPHKYSSEMSKKSELCSLGMEFHNPNVASDMAQILKNFQHKYVPCSIANRKDVVENVPLHGDQLFEERARNVQLTYQVGDSKYEKLSSLPPEHADWHAKVTLYKIQSDIFVSDASVGEIGTSRASMTRTGKTNAAKGVHNHYNEYKEFHSRELESHICASFMEFCKISNINDQPSVSFPDSSSSRKVKMEWLLQLCKDYITKFVLILGMDVIVEQTNELDRCTKEGFPCRSEGCASTFTLHSRRVRHEVEKHNLNLEPPFHTDERDNFGYYICRNNCGMCFKTKSTRNRHERQFHPECSFHKQGNENEVETSSSEKPKEDYLYNYHQSKLTMGLLIMGFEDAVKEGDGQRLCDIYKVALLLYKSYGHYKYAYVTLLFLVKLVATLPKSEAERLKWNRFFNNRGEKGCNISLDLKKEHQNCLIKKMWRSLGPNLNETNAARLAGTIDAVEAILENVDRDCSLKKRNAYRSEAMKDDAVYQIVSDLVSIKAFQYTLGRSGHPSFPGISSNLVKKLDFRDLHKWMNERLKEWKSLCD